MANTYDPYELATQKERLQGRGAAGYRRDLLAASTAEEELFNQLHRDTLAQNQAQLQRQIQTGRGAFYGGAAQAGGGGALRGAAYAAGDLNQRGYLQGEAINAAAEQEMAAYYQDLLARRGQYETNAQQVQTSYDALEAAHQAQEDAARQQRNEEEQAKQDAAVGMGASMLSAGLVNVGSYTKAEEDEAKSDMKLKTNVNQLHSDERLKRQAYEAGLRHGRGTSGDNSGVTEVSDANTRYYTNADDVDATRGLPPPPVQGRNPAREPLASGRSRGRQRDFWDDSYDIMNLESGPQEHNKMRLRRAVHGYEGVAGKGVGAAAQASGATRMYAPGHPEYEGEGEPMLAYDPGRMRFEPKSGDRPTVAFHPEEVTAMPRNTAYVGRGNPAMEYDVADMAFTPTDQDSAVYMPEDQVYSDKHSKNVISDLKAQNVALTSELDRVSPKVKGGPSAEDEWEGIYAGIEFASKSGDPRSLDFAYAEAADFARRQGQLKTAADYEQARAAVRPPDAQAATKRRSVDEITDELYQEHDNVLNEMSFQGKVKPMRQRDEEATRLGRELDAAGDDTLGTMMAQGKVDPQRNRSYAAEPPAPEGEMSWTSDLPMRRDQRGRQMEQETLRAVQDEIRKRSALDAGTSTAQDAGPIRTQDAVIRANRGLRDEGRMTMAKLHNMGPVRPEGRLELPADDLDTPLTPDEVGQYNDYMGSHGLSEVSPRVKAWYDRDLAEGNTEDVLRSDEKLKKKVGATSPEDEFLDTLNGYTYEYKPEAQQELGLDAGMKYGIMAQDVEKTPLGATMVKNTPDGKVIDIKSAVGSLLAGEGRLNERLRKLEGKKK